jgi:hypothetical protein
MYTRVIRYRVSGGAGIWAREAPLPLQSSSLMHADDWGLHLSIEVYPDEESARSAPVAPEWEVEPDEIWTGPMLVWTDYAEEMRKDPARFHARVALTWALAKRLAPVVPAGFTTELLTAWVAETLKHVFDDLSHSTAEAVVAAASSVLHKLDDEVPETIRVPWSLEAWDVEIEGDFLRLGAGLGRIPLRELGLNTES